MRCGLQQRRAALGAAVEVLERPLVGGLGDAERRGADQRPGHLEGRQRVGRARLLARAGRARASSRSFSSPPSRFSTGIRQSSRTTSAVCEARIPSLLSFLPWLRPGRALGDDERGLAAGAELGVDGGDDDVDVGDAAVGDEDLGPVQDPLVAVALGGRLQALDVGAGLRLGHRVGAELDLVAAAEALGDPAGDLLGRAGGGDAGGGEARSRRSPARCRRSPSGTPRPRSPASGPRGRRPSAASPRAPPKPCLRASLMTSQGMLSSSSCLRRRRADHLAGEGPAALLVLELLVVECEVHSVPSARRRHGSAG